MQASVRIINELSDGIASFPSAVPGEAQKCIQTTLVNSFDSLTEEFELLKECASHSNEDAACTLKLNASSNQVGQVSAQKSKIIS